MRIAISKSVRRQFPGSRTVCLFKQRRQVLGIVLILEAADKVLGRKLIRRFRLIAQQIAHRVVVLAVRQPPQNRSGSPLRVRAGFIVLQSGCEFVGRHGRKKSDPGNERRLFRATRLNALAACMRNAPGGFLQQQRFFGMLPVYKPNQRAAEGFNTLRRR